MYSPTKNPYSIPRRLTKFCFLRMAFSSISHHSLHQTTLDPTFCLCRLSKKLFCSPVKILPNLQGPAQKLPLQGPRPDPPLGKHHTSPSPHSLSCVLIPDRHVSSLLRVMNNLCAKAISYSYSYIQPILNKLLLCVRHCIALELL